MNRFRDRRPATSAQELLERLERRSVGLPTDERSMLLNEIRAHLDADVQARMELGLGREMAEQEAIEAFGDPLLVVRRLEAVHRPNRVDKPFATVLICFFAFFAVTLLADWSEFVPMEVTGTALTLMLVFGLPILSYTAWRAKTFQWRTFLMAYPVVSLWFAMVGAFSYLPDAEPPTFGTPYSGAREAGLELIRYADAMDAKAAALEPYVARFAAGENVVPPRSLFPEDGYKTETVANREAAMKIWLRFRTPAEYRQTASFQRADGESLVNLDRSNWWRGIPYGYLLTQIIAAGWLAIIAVLSLSISMLRLGAERLRQRWDRRLRS